MSKVESFDNIWDAIADTAGESANMQVKAELMSQIVAIVKKTIGNKLKLLNIAELSSLD